MCYLGFQNNMSYIKILCKMQFEAVVEKGHEPLVHHMLLYACTFPVNDTFDGVGDFCYQKNKAEVISACTGTIFGWPTGGNVSGNFESSHIVPFPHKNSVPFTEIEKCEKRKFVLIFLTIFVLSFSRILNFQRTSDTPLDLVIQISID